ncbi:MAG: sigma-70 family RNA polymerase sigma factor [Muribaculaceae bacterium]|nr:sigma-70 family RNA polymerase sigma factor [Muribaculaceae bacterium]
MKSPPVNENEFASIIREHAALINKVCFFYATDKIPYDDLRQEIYVNLWLGISKFRGDCKISTWIYRVAVNSALMAIRNYKSKLETLPIEFTPHELSSEVDDEQKERLQSLYEIINCLQPIEKALILLWLDEYQYDEIAEIMDMPRNTIATKLRRIKEKLINSNN